MLAKADKIVSCYIGPQISPEHFISETFFLFLTTGVLEGYDGYKKYTLKPGECCMVLKNHLARYNKQKVDNQFEKVVVVFDDAFLKRFQGKNKITFGKEAATQDAFILINKNKLIPAFLSSLKLYFNEQGRVDETFAEVKREELLLILLQTNPEIADVLFDFGAPEKINLEAFMNHNFRFNVNIQRFAYLTGRSLTSFKEDFKRIFNETPSRWLTKKRLQEAYFLIDKKGQKPSEVYLEAGFEDLSHFSFAFKKLFGIPPSQLSERHQNSVQRQ
jgi:AraC-like DNA-binding protein